MQSVIVPWRLIATEQIAKSQYVSPSTYTLRTLITTRTVVSCCCSSSLENELKSARRILYAWSSIPFPKARPLYLHSLLRQLFMVHSSDLQQQLLRPSSPSTSFLATLLTINETTLTKQATVSRIQLRPRYFAFWLLLLCRHLIKIAHHVLVVVSSFI